MVLHPARRPLRTPATHTFRFISHLSHESPTFLLLPTHATLLIRQGAHDLILRLTPGARAALLRLREEQARFWRHKHSPSPLKVTEKQLGAHPQHVDSAGQVEIRVRRVLLAPYSTLARRLSTSSHLKRLPSRSLRPHIRLARLTKTLATAQARLLASGADAKPRTFARWLAYPFWLLAARVLSLRVGWRLERQRRLHRQARPGAAGAPLVISWCRTLIRTLLRTLQARLLHTQHPTEHVFVRPCPALPLSDR